MKRTLLSVLAILAISLVAVAQNWIVQSTGFATQFRGINHVCVVDANTVWVTAYDGSGSGNPCQDYSRTVNGGTLWTPGTIPGITALDLAMVSAIDDQNAWVVAYPPASTTTGMGIWHTSDGGTTWNRQATALFNNASSFPNCVHFFDANNGWCMGDPINGEYEIYTTTDGGTTWTAVPGAQIPNPTSGEFGIVGYYSVVGDIIWFGTNKSRVFKSTDRGYNWTVGQITGWGNRYSFPAFKDDNYGIVQDRNQATTGAMVNSSDGGATWAPITTTGTVYWNDLAYIPGSPATFVTSGAATNYSGFTYSWDDGITWNEMAETIGTQFLDMGWLNDSTGWAGSFNNDAVTDGIFKFNAVLALPAANFVASDSAITLGSQVTFTNLSTGNPTTQAWTFEGGAPGSSTAKNPPPITYNTPGDFTVSLRCTNAFGSDTLEKIDYIHVGGVGINDQSSLSMTIYPNPVRDFLKIEASKTIQEIQVINLVGQTVIDRKVDNSTVTLSTSDLNGGVYTLKVKINDKYYVRKVVVN
jgi:PKD repeat protein